MSSQVIEFGSNRLEFDSGEAREVETFIPPQGLSPDQVEAALREALEHSRDYPPLRRNVVPGDRVAIALDPELRDPCRLIDVVTDVLEGAGVEADAITIVEASPLSAPVVSGNRGEHVEVHDPTNRERLAYLATTKQESRIYLNRTLTDADIVVPIGLLRYDPLTGVHGPWSSLYPGLSDEDSRAARRKAQGGDAEGGAPQIADPEAFEVGWLLGSQFQIGVVPGSNGPSAFVGGLAEAVRDEGLSLLARSWSFRPEARAEIVAVGVGGAEAASSLHDLIAALATGSRLVQRGGRIIALSEVGGSLGPAMQRLASAADDPDARNALRGCEAEPDFAMAAQLARILAWADVYLLSRLDSSTVEDLSMIPLERPEEARRLLARSGSSFLVSRAERVWVEVADDGRA